MDNKLMIKRTFISFAYQDECMVVIALRTGEFVYLGFDEPEEAGVAVTLLSGTSGYVTLRANQKIRVKEAVR